MFRSLADISMDYTTKAQMQIQGAFTRAQDAHYRVRWARGWQYREIGYMFWRVPSSRPADFPTGHVVSVQRDQNGDNHWRCDCEACVYGRAFLCVHVATVITRLERKRKAGTRKLARLGRELIGA